MTRSDGARCQQFLRDGLRIFGNRPDRRMLRALMPACAGNALAPGKQFCRPPARAA